MAVLFDFGGVLADEGFREGIRAIGKRNGLDPDALFDLADELIYETGYVEGMAEEAVFWEAFRQRTGIASADEELREEILARFTLREGVLKYVERARASGIVTGILSDQTDWLYELDRRAPFFHLFDHVYNSFDLRKGKRDPSVFRDVTGRLGLKPEEVLFVDDKIGNISRARGSGLKVLHFRNMDCFEKGMKNLLRSWEERASPIEP
jgi:putative hydrolase of the HAD superfamily